MKSFTYTIADPVGIHARPAGILVKEIKQYSDVTVTIAKDGKSMGIKQGDEVTVSVEGKNEDEVAGKIEEFYKTYF